MYIELYDIFIEVLDKIIIPWRLHRWEEMWGVHQGIFVVGNPNLGFPRTSN
jgi:hypothetical protein